MFVCMHSVVVRVVVVPYRIKLEKKEVFMSYIYVRVLFSFLLLIEAKYA